MAQREKKPDIKTDQAPRLPIKTAVTLSFEANRRLRAACLAERKTQSELVEGLVHRHLGGYFVGKRRDGLAAEHGEPEPDAQDAPGPTVPTG